MIRKVNVLDLNRIPNKIICNYKMYYILVHEVCRVCVFNWNMFVNWYMNNALH